MTGNELTSVRLTTNKLFKRVSMQARVAQRYNALARLFPALPGPGFNSLRWQFSSLVVCISFLN